MLKRYWMAILMALAGAHALAAPTVSLTAPAANSSYVAPATITLSADAASSDGTIVQVAFYHGQALIGSTSSAPYTLDWPQVGAGTYQLTAVATDSLNASTTSAPVTVTVNAAAPAQQVYYIHSDHLNTPRLITDQNNHAVWQWDSDPFGTTVANEDPSNTGTAFAFNPRFPGQYFDRETGLHYNYFRDYDPHTGRYLQSDPIGLDGGIHTYAYVGGNPVSYIDPLGLVEVYRSGGVTINVYPGPPAGGNEHARAGAGENYHAHMRDSAGREARISTETWKPLTPEDQRIFDKSKAMQNVCEKLTDGEKKFLDRVNRQVFHRGAPTVNQVLRLVQMRGGIGASTTRGTD